MKVALLYLHVGSDPARFVPYAQRFMETYRKFPSGYPHELHIVICNGDMSDSVYRLYHPEACCFHRYQGNGFDIGAHQSVAVRLHCDFMVSTCSSTYFYREGWLKRFVDARDKHGDGLYSSMASYEVSAHLRTAFYGLSPALFRRYPYFINSKEDTFRFEHREWSVSQWVASLGMPVMLVTWNGCYDRDGWRTPANGFRKGDQTDCLAWDRHNDIFAQSDPGERARLQMTSG